MNTQRPNKFKVWDTKDQKWLISPKVVFIHHEKSWGNEFYLEIDEEWGSPDIDEEWGSPDYDPTRYIFVESTGLKDKNGVEIYEGDTFDLNGQIGIVVWDALLVGFVFKMYKQNFCISPHSLDQVEVIGNIYENKELVGIGGEE